MAVISKTIQEYRDQILERIGVQTTGTDDWQGIVLDELNNAVTFVLGLHEWACIRKKTTITASDNTGIIQLPDDVDRILSLHTPGTNLFLTEVTPMQLEEVKEDPNVSSPSFFSLFFDQDTTTEAVHEEVEIFAAPSSGTSYTLWYSKYIDEFTTSDLAKVPKLAPVVWDLVRQKALLECLKKAEAAKASIINAERNFVMSLNLAKQREDLGTSKYPSIRQNADYASHYKTRMRH